MKKITTLVATMILSCSAYAVPCGESLFEKYDIKGKESNNVTSYCNDANTNLSDYETVIPLAKSYALQQGEQKALIKYLDNIENTKAIKELAVFHLQRSLVLKPTSGSGVFHSIIADYFLTQLEDKKPKNNWVSDAKSDNQQALSLALKIADVTDMAEDHAAQKFFLETFNYNEQNRHSALSLLLDDIAVNPNNVYSSFLIMAGNLWVGGETAYDDPSALYNFLVGSYFGAHTMKLEKQAQAAWQQDNINPRFRLANISGGIDLSHRIWLANLHKDEVAKQKLADEHDLWFDLNPAFHAFTVGLAYFDSETEFEKGYQAWGVGMSECLKRTDLRTCPDGARFSFNMIGFSLGWFDFLIKNGELDKAKEVLTWRHAPHLMYQDWDMGQPAWQHREQNFDAIAALYANDDPSDDPMHLNLKKRKWGSSTSTCSSCHQAQSRQWTQEDKDLITLPPEDILTIDQWPERSTNWKVL